MKLKKKGILASGILTLFCLLFAALFGIGEGAVKGMTEELDALTAGERWSADGEPYAVITLHTDENSAFSRSRIESFAMSIDSGLLNASIESAENGSAWTYSYFTENMLSVTGTKATSQIQTMAVGGSFFTFHPLDFVYGAPFSYDRALPDGVVLDEDAAWRLFGAIDVVGMTLQIGGRDMTVTGIVQKERDTDGYTRAYGDIPRMYMSYYGYENIYGEGSSITTYEVTLPNPVKGFAMNIFETAVQVNEDTMILRENSARYSIFNRFDRMKELPFMGMRNDRIIYPYFENEMQVTDYRTSLWMVFQTASGAGALICLLAAVICLFASGFSVTAGLKTTGQSIGSLWKKRERTRIRHKKKKRSKKPVLQPEEL